MKVASTTVVLLVVFFVFPGYLKLAEGWSGSPLFLHQLMTRDALEGLECISQKVGITEVSMYANLVDQQLPHCTVACHRLKLFQKTFHAYGGEQCHLKGAEDWASEFVTKARDSYVAGNRAEGDRYLGYAAHFIQDALCPAHVFPFKEGLKSAHASFESYTDKAYNERETWRSHVRNVSPTYVSNVEHLRDEIIRAALWVNSEVDCSFEAQDGNSYRSTRQGTYERISQVEPVSVSLAGGVYRSEGWRITDDDIGRIMEKAASLVKGAAIWAVCQTVHVYSMDNQDRGKDPSRQTDLGGSIMISYTRCGIGRSEVRVTPYWVNVDRNSRVTLSVASNPNGWSFIKWWDDYAHGQRNADTFTFDVATNDHAVAAFFFVGYTLYVRAYPNTQHWPNNVQSDLNANVEIQYIRLDGSEATEAKTTPFFVYCYRGSKARVSIGAPYPSGYTWNSNSKWDNYAHGYAPLGESSMEVELDRDRTAVAYFSPRRLKAANVQPTEDTRRCLIATATYGSELSPEVQFLRSFRNNMILRSFAGSSFLQSFNSWYYSFSPQVAQLIAESQFLKDVVKLSLYPLLGILTTTTGAHAAFAFHPELATLMTGILSSALIGLTYLSPPMILVSAVGHNRKTRRALYLKPRSLMQ
jgi:hypothetical protein